MTNVSVIVPCYNEQTTIQKLLEALLSQTFPRDQIEVVIAEGGSTDATVQRITEFQAAHPDLQIRFVENPQRSIPSGLNRALEAACGDVIIRLDAHSVPASNYIQTCVSDLEQGLGDSVGGVWEIQPRGPGWQARSIAAAASNRLAVGDAQYRYTRTAKLVDTVPFGAFQRALVEKIGPFDESLLSNEDYEFNVRIRQAGGKIWLNPEIRSIYYARQNFFELGRQYARYGYWKARMLRRYPGSLRWRQALPPLFILSLLLGVLIAPWCTLAAWIIVLESFLYALLLLASGLQAALKRRDIAMIPGIPIAIATMHFAWGGAFLWSLIFR